MWSDGGGAQDGEVRVTVGVDTHTDQHVAVALDQFGRRLGTRSVPTTPAGFAALLAVLAIAARGMVSLVERYQALEREGVKPGVGLVVRGAGERLTATAIPAIVTAVALLPLVVTGTIAGQEIAHPIAVIVLGGLVTSTLVVTFLIPAVYLSTMHWRTHDAAP